VKYVTKAILDHPFHARFLKKEKATTEHLLLLSQIQEPLSNLWQA
jgi:hypothetical protein